jgi:hypothetical protein
MVSSFRRESQIEPPSLDFILQRINSATDFTCSRCPSSQRWSTPQPSDLGRRAATLELGADDLVVGSVGTRP